MTAPRLFDVRYIFPAILTLWLFCTQSSNAVSSLPVALFLDEYCNDASPINPNVNIPLNTCILTPGAFGMKAQGLICDNGNEVHFLLYYGTACSGNEADSWGTSCQEVWPSALSGFVAYCGSEEQLQITSTTRIPVATNILSTATTAAASAPTVVTGATTPTTTAITTTAAMTSQSSGTISSSPSSTSSGHGWSSLSNSDRIGAIIALAIGIPSVILAAVGICVACARRGR